MPKHVVRPGDTLKNIAKKYNVGLPHLCAANSRLDGHDSLQPGDVIFIPDLADGTFAYADPLNLKPQLLTMMGISPRQIQEHYKIYQGYVVKTNEIRHKLRSSDRNDFDTSYSSIRSLKISESFAVGGYKLHELYFENLGGRGGKAGGSLFETIVRDFGTYDFWEKDFRSTALSYRGWVILGYDYNDKHLHNYGLDSHDQGLVIRFEPLLVVDVYEHAYFIDYGTNRASYLDALFGNIDWTVVNTRWQNIEK